MSQTKKLELEINSTPILYLTKKLAIKFQFQYLGGNYFYGVG